MFRFTRKVTLLVAALLLFSVPNLVSASSTATQEDPGLLVRKIMGLAYESNESINSSPFGIGDSLRQVKKAWGPADDTSTVAANYYAHYVRFLYNSKGKQTITAIDDFDPQLQTIHLSDVTGLLGEPASAVEQEGVYYVTYDLHNGHQVVFQFGSPKVSSDPTLFMYTVK